MKIRKITVKIRSVMDESKIDSHRVRAYILSDMFAAHKTVVRGGTAKNGCRLDKYKWTLTHLPTRLAVSRYLNGLSGALNVYVGLKDLIDWSVITMENSSIIHDEIKRNMKLFKKIINENTI